ncbi:MAG: threonine/serine exporter family protein [Clostridiaceae bacterium]
MDKNKLMKLAVDAGKIILENGGETYRVEETIIIICKSYNIGDADCYVTPTGIMFSATGDNNENQSIIRRIKTRTIDLEKINLVNILSRNIAKGEVSPSALEDEIKKIKNYKKYKNSTLVFFSSIAAGFFTLLFNGNFIDFLVSLLIGSILKIFTIALNKIKINEFFINISGGFLIAFIASLMFYISPKLNIDTIIIGCIMLLVPGLSFTNSIRDTIAGDIVSGISKAVEATLMALAIATGTGILFKIWY